MGKVKNFFISAGRWIKNHAPTRRRIIQVYAALLCNANIRGFALGRIYQGATKNICTPGLNCYSCPGAVAACPLGALQASLANSSTSTPYYILGILALLGLAFGRMICGFFCPVGLMQDLLYKVKSPKLKKSRYTRILSYFKYVLLVVLVIAVPLIYKGVPAFCKYICPAGTFEGSVSLLAVNDDFFGMLGFLFSWKFILLVVFAIAAIFIYRVFCRFFCPLGAIYGLFCKIALLGVKLDRSKCIDCGKCIQTCKMDIRHVGDHECINCGDCVPVCPTKAITWKGSKIFVQPASVQALAPAAPAEESAPLTRFINGGDAVHTEPVRDAAVSAEQVTEQPQTVQAATEQREVPPVVEVTEAEKRYEQACKKIKKRNLWLQICAWALALGVLIGALVYYNFILPAPVTSSSVKLSEEQYTASFETYSTAAEGEGFSVAESKNKATVIVFFSTKIANDFAAEMIDELYAHKAEFEDKAVIVAMHANNGVPAETVQSYIDEHGWNAYDMIFAQDNSTELYSACGGDGSYPNTVFISCNGNVSSSVSGKMEISEVDAAIDTSLYRCIYSVGDYVPLFVLDTVYKTEVEEDSFSLADCLGKVTVINFWYTKCDPCVAELPSFEKVNRDYGGAINTVVVHSDNGTSSSDVQNMIDSADEKLNKSSWSNWSLLFTHDNSSVNVYTILGGKGAFPYTVVLDAEGRISGVHHSGIKEEDLRAMIEEAAAR